MPQTLLLYTLCQGVGYKVESGPQDFKKYSLVFKSMYSYQDLKFLSK